MTPAQTKFFFDDLFSLVLQATTQRSITYAKGASDEQKAAFRNDLRRRLERLAKGYETQNAKQISVAKHVRNIVDLSEVLSTKFSGCLWKKQFRVGSAQKAINLYLKYLWCLGRINIPPPHCPLDNRIIRKLGLKLKWTELTDIAVYKDLMERAEKKASKDSLTIAEWELIEYNRAKR